MPFYAEDQDRSHLAAVKDASGYRRFAYFHAVLMAAHRRFTECDGASPELACNAVRPAIRPIINRWDDLISMKLWIAAVSLGKRGEELERHLKVASDVGSLSEIAQNLEETTQPVLRAFLVNVSEVFLEVVSRAAAAEIELPYPGDKDAWLRIGDQ